MSSIGRLKRDNLILMFEDMRPVPAKVGATQVQLASAWNLYLILGLGYMAAIDNANPATITGVKLTSPCYF
jgi:hypothetical protein